MCDHTEGPHHDCAHVNARNACIREAELIALMEVGREAPPEIWGPAFLRAMERVWRRHTVRETYEEIVDTPVFRPVALPEDAA